MKVLLLIASLVLTGAPAAAAVNNDALPDNTAWYLHVDLERMRDTEVGKTLYDWMKDEVFNEIREDTGFDFDREVNSLTAFGGESGQATMLVRGALQQTSKDKLMAVMAAAGDMQLQSQGKLSYYRVDNLDIKDKDLSIDGDTLYFGFKGDDQLVVSTELNNLTDALSGKRPQGPKTGRAMLVLNAERSLMQAGMDAAALNDERRQRWNSGMLRQARQLAFVLSDSNGNADLELKITADDPQVTDSLAAIVRGLIGLQALSQDTNAEIKQLLGALKIDTDDKGLSLRLNVAPQVLTGLINQ